MARELDTAADYVFPMSRVRLSSRARYSDVPEISRLEAIGSPAHVAFHLVGGSEPQRRSYCKPHRHDFAELNLLLGEPGALRYRLLLGGDELLVESPMSVWIPAGLVHSANLEGGTGTFVVVYLREPQPNIP